MSLAAFPLLRGRVSNPCVIKRENGLYVHTWKRIRKKIERKKRDTEKSAVCLKALVPIERKVRIYYKLRWEREREKWWRNSSACWRKKGEFAVGVHLPVLLWPHRLLLGFISIGRKNSVHFQEPKRGRKRRDRPETRRAEISCGVSRRISSLSVAAGRFPTSSFSHASSSPPCVTINQVNKLLCRPHQK